MERCVPNRQRLAFRSVPANTTTTAKGIQPTKSFKQVLFAKVDVGVRAVRQARRAGHADADAVYKGQKGRYGCRSQSCDTGSFYRIKSSVDSYSERATIRRNGLFRPGTGESVVLGQPEKLCCDAVNHPTGHQKPAGSARDSGSFLCP